MSSLLWRRNWTSYYQLFERRPVSSQSKGRANDATTRCISMSKHLSDKFVWRWKWKGCKTNILVRDSSFFTKSKLPSMQLGVSQQTLVNNNKILDLKWSRFKLYLILVLQLLYWGFVYLNHNSSIWPHWHRGVVYLNWSRFLIRR